MADPETTTWLSEEDYRRLQDELEHLRSEGRRKVSEEIQTAREHGDLSENAEYDAAKERQGQMEARIRQLEALLENAETGAPEHDDAVAPGHVVTLDIDGDRETYLVGSRENAPDDVDTLSTDSPIGRAVLGESVGATVEVQAPAGSFRVTVTDIGTGTGRPDED